jgi:hypothetical protein
LSHPCSITQCVHSDDVFDGGSGIVTALDPIYDNVIDNVSDNVCKDVPTSLDNCHSPPIVLSLYTTQATLNIFVIYLIAALALLFVLLLFLDSTLRLVSFLPHISPLLPTLPPLHLLWSLFSLLISTSSPFTLVSLI